MTLFPKNRSLGFEINVQGKSISNGKLIRLCQERQGGEHHRQPDKCSPYWDLYHYVEGWGSGWDSCQLAQYLPTEINVFWVAEGYATQNANIIQTVKKCYKIKNDSIELKSRFWWFFHGYSSRFLSFRASLLSKGTTFGMQGSPFCILKRLHLDCKRSTFHCKCTPFSQ